MQTDINVSRNTVYSANSDSFSTNDLNRPMRRNQDQRGRESVSRVISLLRNTPAPSLTEKTPMHSFLVASASFVSAHPSLQTRRMAAVRSPLSFCRSRNDQDVQQHGDATRSQSESYVETHVLHRRSFRRRSGACASSSIGRSPRHVSQRCVNTMKRHNSSHQEKQGEGRASSQALRMLPCRAFRDQGTKCSKIASSR